MDSSIRSQRARPPAGKLDPYRGSRKPRRGTLHLPVDLLTISKRGMWQIILAIVPLVTSTAAYKDSRLAASYQTLSGTRPTSPAPFSFQNSTNRWDMTNRDLSNGSTKGHPPWHAMGRYPYSENADHSSTDLPTQAGFLNNQYRKNETSYLTPTRLESLGASSKGSVSPVETTPRTTEAGMKDLHSNRGALTHSSVASMLHHSTNILSGSLPTQSFESSSRKTHSEQMTLHTGQELAITELAGRVPTTSVAPVTQLRFSVMSPSSHSTEVSFHLALPELRDFTGSTMSRGFPTHHQVEPLGTSLFRSVPAATTVDTHNKYARSTSAVGTHLEAKHYMCTEVLPSSVFPYSGSQHSIPCGHGLSSAVAWINSLSQPSTVESITQWSQRSNTIDDYSSRNTDLPVTPYSPKVESSSDMANSSQLAIEIPTHIPHSSEAGMPEFSLSLATTQLGPDRVAVGIPTEPNLSLVQQSSQQKNDLRSQTLAILPLSLGTTRAYEASSLATEDTLSTSLTERTQLELKDVTSHRGEEEHIELGVGPTYDANSQSISGTISFCTDLIYWQPSTATPHGMLHSEGTGTGYDTPLLQDGPLEAVTNAPSSWELVKTEWSTTTSVVSPIFSSELPLSTTEAALTLGSASSLISVQPKAELESQLYTFPQRWSKATSSPPDSTPFTTSRVVLTSEEPGLEILAVPSAAMKGGNTIAETLSEVTEATLASHPYPDTAGFTLPIGPTSPGMAYASLHTGGPTASPAMELFSVTSPEWKNDVPIALHATVSLANSTEPERASVVTTSGSVSTSFTSLDFFGTRAPELTLEMHIGATEKTREEAPEVTVLSRLSSAEVWQPDSKAVTSSPTSSLYRIAPPLLPTKDLESDLNTSAATTTLGPDLRYGSLNSSTAIVSLDDGTTTLPVLDPGYTDSSSSKSPAFMSVSETASAPDLPTFSATTGVLITPRFLPDEPKSTCSNISCLMRTIPSSFTPSPPQLLTTSQPFLSKQVLGSTLGAADVGKNRSTVGVGAGATSPKEISARTAADPERVTVIPGGHSSEQPVSTSKGPVLGESTTKENLTALSTSALPVPAVHTLPLWFRLTGINYTESLENKSSESYKKLEKEVKLTVNKMLSTYENFLQTNILGFLNGSVVVQSEAVFQTRSPVPTPSDVIRTIVTEVERRAMDTFFDWRLDIQSLRSNGFTLSNLEPEKLAVSFTVLGLSSRGVLGDMMNWDHLENLRNKVTLLIGARYVVQNISLVESGNIQGGIDINGDIYIDTDTHVDIGWALEALMALSKYSVDLTSLSINGSRLSLQVFPVSFLVTNRMFNEKMMDRSSAEHQNLVRDLSDVLMHVLGKYKNLLQVAIREITGGSLVCHGDVIFQHPAPTSKDVLQTLTFAVGPRDYLDSSTLQVDPFSFTVAGDGLEPPFANLGIPSYAIAIIALFVLTLIALPILLLLPKMLGRRDKIIINRSRDLEAGTEMFELDNPAFRPTVEEVHLDCLNMNMMMMDTCPFQQQHSVRSTKAFSDGGMMAHSI